MRVGSNNPKWLLSDHLGSQSIVASYNGLTEEGELRYKAWGETRYTSGTTPTKRQYTGQLSDSYINLYWYESRWYDPSIMRWLSPDSIVPLTTQGVQAWDRYAYANNNPVRFNDPSGHWIESLLDIASIAYDIYDISQNGLNWGTGLALAADVGGLILPGVTGGGIAVRALTHADEAIDAVRAVNTVSNGASGVAKFAGTIFRNASGTADSLTPRPGVDDVPGGGLSFFKGLEYLNPGKYVAVDPNKFNNLTAVLDDTPPGHVNVAPETFAKLQEWAATRGTGVIHELTQEVIDAITGLGKK